MALLASIKSRVETPFVLPARGESRMGRGEEEDEDEEDGRTG